MPNSFKLFLNDEILRNIHDNAVDVIITIDRNGIMKSANPAASRMLGYALDELLGRNVKMVMPSPFKEDHDSFIQQFLRTGIRKILGTGREVVAQRKDGNVIPVHLAVSAVQSEGDVVFVGFLRDLSQYKESEAKLQSKMLMNERLAAIGQTISGLAHESRNVFQRSHACLAELELDLDEMPNSLNLVRKVQRALDDLHHLLEEVRNYAAPIILEKRALSIERLVREVWQNIIDARSHESPPELAISIEPDFPVSCMIDGDRFKQVIRNLIDNAWFACKEPRKIQIRLTSEKLGSPLNSCLCRVEVTDNGNGILQKDREIIFTPFYTTKTKGTGLGLALSRRYVEAHDGRIFVKERPATEQKAISSLAGSIEIADKTAPIPGYGDGACFVVEFPHCSEKPHRKGQIA